MSLGQAWKLGVVYPLINPSFRYPISHEATLDASYSSGSTFTVDASSYSGGWNPGHHLENYVDDVTLGPSSNSSHEGRTESHLVTSASISSANVTIDVTNPDYDYDAGDYICWVGSKFPGGWDLAGASSNLTSDIVSGYDDEYAMRISLASTVADIYFRMTDTDSTVAECLPLPESGVVYYAGCYYKATSISGTAQLRFINAFSSNLELSLTTQADWTLTSGTMTSLAAASAVVPNVHVKLSALSVINNLDLDCLFMCHAHKTSGAASGYYEFGTPDRGSISINRREQARYSMLTNGTSTGHIAGLDDIKYSIGATFTGVNSTVLENLYKLFWWQQRGNILCLETGLLELPPWLFGRIEMKFPKQDFDLDKTTVQLKFVEV